MSPNPKIPRIEHYSGLEQYDRDLNSDLYKELKELRAQLNLRDSGSYTPTLTNTTNLTASTAHLCYYMRQGNVVQVAGIVDVDPTAAGTTTLKMSLPLACDLTTAYQLAGIAAGGLTAGDHAIISADTTNNIAQFQWNAADLTNHSFGFTFTYSLVN